MGRRAGGLYLPLDVNFNDDPKVMNAGERASWLYLHMALKSKQLLSDGVLSAGQIARLGVSAWRGRLEKLIEVGLVIPWDPDMDSYAIVAWFKHNDSAVEVDMARNKDAAHKKAVREARLRILTRDGGRCLYCGSTTDLAIDHIKPVVSGGTHDDWNLQTLCKSCNSRKGRRDATGLTLEQARAAFGIRFTGHLPDTSPDTNPLSSNHPAVRDKRSREKGSEGPRPVPHGPCPGCSDCPASLKVVGS